VRLRRRRAPAPQRGLCSEALREEQRGAWRGERTHARAHTHTHTHTHTQPRGYGGAAARRSGAGPSLRLVEHQALRGGRPRGVALGGLVEREEAAVARLREREAEEGEARVAEGVAAEAVPRLLDLRARAQAVGRAAGGARGGSALLPAGPGAPTVMASRFQLLSDIALIRSQPVACFGISQPFTSTIPRGTTVDSSRDAPAASEPATCAPDAPSNRLSCRLPPR